MQYVVRSIDIQAAPSTVWRWLATQEGLRRWISPNIEIDVRVGGAYRFLGPDNETWISGRVLELVPEKSLILSWLEEGSGWIHPARLVITLAATVGGTRATIIHDGLRELVVRTGLTQHRIMSAEPTGTEFSTDSPIW